MLTTELARIRRTILLGPLSEVAMLDPNSLSVSQRAGNIRVDASEEDARKSNPTIATVNTRLKMAQRSSKLMK